MSLILKSVSFTKPSMTDVLKTLTARQKNANEFRIEDFDVVVHLLRDSESDVAEGTLEIEVKIPGAEPVTKNTAFRLDEAQLSCPVRVDFSGPTSVSGREKSGNLSVKVMAPGVNIGSGQSFSVEHINN